nr:MAG TPA: hypothetical protein [Caudoviricetes sp.]
MPSQFAQPFQTFKTLHGSACHAASQVLISKLAHTFCAHVVDLFHKQRVNIFANILFFMRNSKEITIILYIF